LGPRFHAEVLDDEEVDLGESADELLSLLKGLGLEEVLGEVEGAADEDAVAGADRPQGDGGGDVALADPGGPDQEHVLVEGDEASGGELGDLGPGDLGIEGPVEVLDLLDLGDLGLFDAACEEPIGPAAQLVLHEKLEKLEVGQGSGGGLGESSGKSLGHAG